MHFLGNIDKNAKNLIFHFPQLSGERDIYIQLTERNLKKKKMQNFIRRKNFFGDQATQFMICRNLTPVVYTYAKHSSVGSPVF